MNFIDWARQEVKCGCFQDYFLTCCVQLFKVKYSGTKSYDKKFKDEDTKEAGKTTAYTVESLLPGSKYTFQLYGTSVCGKSISRYATKETKVEGEYLIKTY